MNFRKILRNVLIIPSALIITVGLLSLVHDFSYWYSKILDFPRLQYWIGGIICFVLFLALNKRWHFSSFMLALGLFVAIGIQSIKIFPYWFGEKKVPDATEISSENTVGIMLANVLITNTKYEKFLNLVRQKNPDMLLVMEVNRDWEENLKSLKNDYAYVISRPNDEAYGMMLFSKFPLKEQQVKYFKHDFVPSFHALVELPSGKVFRFHGVHPVAPVPSSKYPDNEGTDEVALLKVGKMVAEEKLPAIVAGDFNDVSWSRTARMFGHNGNLNNVRLGRGLYNSFNAKSIIMRWPLDHVFVTSEFSLKEIDRMASFGSDHFPIYVNLVLNDVL